MGLTVTHTGPSLATLLTSMNGQMAQFMTQMERATVTSIDTETPTSSQTPQNPNMLREHLRKQTISLKVGTTTDYLVHYGPVQGLDIDKAAPKNTILDYLVSTRGRKRKRTARPFPMAWYFLPITDRIQLAMMRQGGQFGGPNPPPKHLWAIQTGAVLNTIPRSHSDYAKYSAAQGFIDRIKATVKAAWDREVALIRL